MEFDRWGRRIGALLLAKGCLRGLQYLLSPLHPVRYWEFAFASSALGRGCIQCLDVSSPRLFSTYVAAHSTAQVLMINPDPRDTEESERVVLSCRVPGVQIKTLGVDWLMGPSMPSGFHAIWSISVMEHIAGDYNDWDSMRAMYTALTRGGRLIVTVPVGRRYHEDYWDTDAYGTQPKTGDGRCFFQRWYDHAAINERLVRAVGHQPSMLRWFGETTAGYYTSYSTRRHREGLRCTVRDPEEALRSYREFASWEDMPGMGICGLMFEKP